MKRIVCFHSDVDFGVTTHLYDRAARHIHCEGRDRPAAVVGILTRLGRARGGAGGSCWGVIVGVGM